MLTKPKIVYNDIVNPKGREPCENGRRYEMHKYWKHIWGVSLEHRVGREWQRIDMFQTLEKAMADYWKAWAQYGSRNVRLVYPPVK